MPEVCGHPCMLHHFDATSYNDILYRVNSSSMAEQEKNPAVKTQNYVECLVEAVMVARNLWFRMTFTSINAMECSVVHILLAM